MRLPEVQFSGPMPDAADDVRRAGAEAQRATGVLAEGLTRYGQEVIKTQTARAMADLSAGLAELEAGINSRRYVKTAELRQELGADFDSLPPALRSKLTTQALDSPSGEVREVDRDDVPMWEVAGAVFDLKAKRLLEKAGKSIRIAGWRGEFENAAADAILSRKVRINRVQMAALDADLRDQQQGAIRTLASAGSFDDAAALVSSSAVFTPAEKEKLGTFVAHERQAQPFEDLVLRGVQTTADVLEAGKLIGRLESGEGLDQMDDRERIERKRELERLVGEFERGQKFATEHAFDALDAAAQDVIVDALVRAKGRPLPFALVPPRGQASPKMREHLYRLIEGTQKGEGAGETDPGVYDLLNRLARDNPRAFVDHDLMGYMAQGKLSLSHFTHFSDLQRTIRTDGLDGVRYSSFVGAQEETDRLLLDQGIQVRGENISENDQRVRGYVHMIVDTELFRATARNKGQPLDLEVRNQLIRSVVAREMRAKAWYQRGKATAPGASVDPQLPDADLRRVAVRLGRDEDALPALAADYSGVVPAIADGWRRVSAKSLRQTEALGVYELMRREQARIDAALEQAGKPKDDRNRAAVAVQLYAGGMR